MDFFIITILVVEVKKNVLYFYVYFINIFYVYFI